MSYHPTPLARWLGVVTASGGVNVGYWWGLGAPEPATHLVAAMPASEKQIWTSERD
jgi:hypothetical protein